MFYVYILSCRDNSFYTGYTNDLESRINNHRSGHGSKYVLSRLPVELVYYEKYQNKSDAMKREWQIKNWSRQKKIFLIKGLLPNKNY